jgi:hypothetical protein
MASNWPGRSRSVRSKLKLARQQLLHSAVVLNDHDQVNTLDPDLQSPASTSYCKECRRAPTILGAASGNATAVLGAEYEAAFQKVGNHSYAPRMFQNLFRNSLIWHGHDFSEHGARMIEPIDRGFAIRFCPAGGCQTQ